MPPLASKILTVYPGAAPVFDKCGPMHGFHPELESGRPQLDGLRVRRHPGRSLSQRLSNTGIGHGESIRRRLYLRQPDDRNRIFQRRGCTCKFTSTAPQSPKWHRLPILTGVHRTFCPNRSTLRTDSVPPPPTRRQSRFIGSELGTIESGSECRAAYFEK